MEIIGNAEAGHARPAVSNFEELERVHEGQNLLLCELSLKHDREQPRRSREITLPQFVPGAGGKSWVQNQFDLRTLRQPIRQFKPRRLDRLQPYRQSLHAAQSQTAVVRRRSAADELMRGPETLVRGFVPHCN